MLFLTKKEAEAYLKLDGARREAVQIVDKESNEEEELPKVVFSVSNQNSDGQKKWFCQMKDLCRFTRIPINQVRQAFKTAEDAATAKFGDWIVTQKVY